ncbi:FlgB family protein [Pseudooceanicola sediminis]|uniref:FlgB family protein n=1 Tax=Pseudooceanicola sediminis TaxID=2211117 RepID=A0A399J4X0_9RHOB|nr:FlgB family protein [Pseudooceanicola sediminis]KAA2315568.1 FlgB family protein [Puniceibacterium sp. HSS470]RII40435.1 FlgB family protein [Pseudooceanicola sediminis]
MFENLQIFRMSESMARHAGQRQTVIAENMANADTPGFKARDILPFPETLNRTAPGFAARATRASHLNGSAGDQGAYESFRDRNMWTSPNGNSVSLEQQVLKSVEVQQEHSRALSIYRSALTIMRTSIGRR